MKKIVIFMQNREFFGAQIVHIPLIKALKARYPENHITLFSKHSVSKVLSYLVDEIVIEQSKWHAFKAYFSLGADITINLRKKSSFINFYTALLNRGSKIGFATPMTKLFFTQTKKHNPKSYRALNYLNLIDQTLEYEKIAKVKRITIIPGAGEDFKIYPIRSYLELATKLKKRYPEYEIAFVLGDKESNLKEYIKEPFKIYFNLDIQKLFEIMSASSLVIANDCGPSHIAQLSDVANIILYSDEKANAKRVAEEWFNPKSNGAYLLSGKNKKITTIEVHDIFREATKLLE